MHRLAAEPQRRALRPERLGLEPDVGEAVVAALERRRRVAPEHLPGRQVLVEQLAAALERHPERLVLGPVPAHRRLDDQAALGQQVERRELLGEQQRVPERRDDRARDQPEPRRRRRDRAQQRERVRPRRRRVLVPGQRVVARVLGHPAGVRPRTEHDVLAHHHRVEPGLLGLDGHPNERAEIARRDERPVLAEDEDEAGPNGPASPSGHHALVRRSASASLAGSRPLTTSMYDQPDARPRSARTTARGSSGSGPCRTTRRSPRP